MHDTITAQAVDPRALRDCCGRFTTGVTVITTRTAEGDHGTTVSAFMSVSLEPALICISLNRQSKMVGKLKEAGRFAVNILSQEMDKHAMHFAGRPDDTLTNLFYERYELPLLNNAAAVLIADVVQQVDAGDHILFLGNVRYLDHAPAMEPLLYHAGQFGSLAVNPDRQTIGV